MKTTKIREGTSTRTKRQANDKGEKSVVDNGPRDSLTRTKAILNAALRVWELKQPGRGGTSVWQRRSTS
jgi:hypothetical protein